MGCLSCMGFIAGDLEIAVNVLQSQGNVDRLCEDCINRPRVLELIATHIVVERGANGTLAHEHVMAHHGPCPVIATDAFTDGSIVQPYYSTLIVRTKAA